MQKEYFEGMRHKLLTLFVHRQLIRKCTFVKPITPTCHWWIFFVCFVFNLCSIWVVQQLKRLFCPPYAIFCATVKRWYFGMGVTLPYILDFGVFVWNDCQTTIYISMRGDHWTVLYQTSWFYYTYVRQRMYPGKSLCKMISFCSHFVHKSGLKLQIIPPNVNKVLQM